MNEQVKRFRPSIQHDYERGISGGTMVESPTGGYVWYDDYDQLRQRVAELEEQARQLNIAAGDHCGRAIQAEERADRYACDNNELRAKLALAEDDAIIGRQVKREMSRRLDVAQSLRRDEPKRIHTDDGYRLLQQIVGDAKVVAWDERRAAIDASGEST